VRLRIDCRKVLELVPDAPCFLETRSMLLDPAQTRVCGESLTDCVVWHSQTGLMTMIGEPGPNLIADTIADSGEVATLLADLSHAATVAEVIPGWELHIAQRLVHAEDCKHHPHNGVRVETVVRAEFAVAASLPERIGRQVAESAAKGAVAAVWIGCELASVCYTGWETESLCDVAVFTQPRHRGKGYASAAAYRLIRHVQSSGRLACWFTDEGNLVSLGLARRLGFRRPDRVAVFHKPFTQENSHGRQGKDS
jgi:GNAT superfamily N-acetyltransferase